MCSPPALERERSGPDSPGFVRKPRKTSRFFPAVLNMDPFRWLCFHGAFLLE